MDPQYTASREDLYHVQMEVKHVQAMQTNHADRILRLEKRQADDAALKSVWGTASPFPSVMGGTPQHGPVPNSTAAVFDDFDDEQSQNLLGSLQLEADEEPVRRGASRANSVRFDISALQGSNWAAGSRNSGEFGPIRPNSGFGSHPMTERSLSHRSDGRHSSAGHSAHSIHSAPSGRASSLGLDTNFLVNDQGDESPLDIPEPPPGLFILGSVPSIIRCWLTTNFSHNALLYAAVCTGAQRSILDHALVKDLGLSHQVQKDSNGRQTVKLPVYLPEAVVTQPSSRSNSPPPQLPTLTVEFEVTGANSPRSSLARKKSIQIFLGSDTLRAHNADILFSKNLMTLYGDDRNKLSVPFVRPEDENIFKNLCTASVPPEKAELKATAPAFTPNATTPKSESYPSIPIQLLNGGDSNEKLEGRSNDDQPASEVSSLIAPNATTESVLHDRASSLKSTTSSLPHNNNAIDSSDRSIQEGSQASEMSASAATSTTEPAHRDSSASGIWGSWRQGSNGLIGPNSENDSTTISTSGYQRPRGGRSMKILKPSSKIHSSSSSTSSHAQPHPHTTTRSTSLSATRTTSASAYEPPAPANTRLSSEARRKSQAAAEHANSRPMGWASKMRMSDDQKAGATTTTKLAAVTGSTATIPGGTSGGDGGGGVTKSSTNNPIGGASAFAWMNSAGVVKEKSSASAGD